MSILILYESKTGFTQECAQDLHRELPGSVLHDLHDRDAFNLDAYDTIVIGAPIYEGEIEYDAARFFAIFKRKLLQKRLGIFCAGMNTAEFNLAVQNSLPPDIFYDAEIVHCGGKIEYESLSRKDKKTIKKRLGITHSQEIRNEQKMNEFIKWVRSDIKK